MERNNYKELLEFNARIMRRKRISVPCFAVCAVFLFIIGFLPLLPQSFTILLRPLAIFSCIVFAEIIHYPASNASKMLLVFLAYVTIILLSHELTASAIKDYISMVLFGLFFIVETERIWSEREIRLIICVTAAAALFCSIVLLNANDSLHAMKGESELSFFGHMKNRNTMGFSIVPGALCSELLLFNDRKRQTPVLRIFYFISLIICGYTVIATGARTASLSMLAGVLMIMLEYTNQSDNIKIRATRKIVIFLLSLLLLYSLICLTEGTESSRIFKHLNDKNGREGLWDFSRQLIHEKPVFGGGFDYWVNMHGDSLGTHNTYYTVMVISGYVGAALLTVFLGSVIIELLYIRSLIPLAFIVELLGHTYSESSLDYYAYIPLILAYILYLYSKNNKLPIKDIFV